MKGYEDLYQKTIFGHFQYGLEVITNGLGSTMFSRKDIKDLIDRVSGYAGLSIRTITWGDPPDIAKSSGNVMVVENAPLESLVEFKEDAYLKLSYHQHEGNMAINIYSRMSFNKAQVKGYLQRLFADSKMECYEAGFDDDKGKRH